MESGKKPIKYAIDELEANLATTARIYEWAELMGYENPKLFARHFIRQFHRRPSEVLTEVRLGSLIEQLRMNDSSCLEVALEHSLPDEKALYNYFKRHLDCSPTEVQAMTEQELQALIAVKFGE